MPTSVTMTCPTCHKQLAWDISNPYRPFCSKRCQLIDLGEWANEEKRIASHPDVTDNESWSEQDTEH